MGIRLKMSKIILAPIGIVAGLLAGQLAKTLFDFVWSRVSDEEAPRPDHHRSRGHAWWRP